VALPSSRLLLPSDCLPALTQAYPMAGEARSSCVATDVGFWLCPQRFLSCHLQSPTDCARIESARRAGADHWPFLAVSHRVRGVSAPCWEARCAVSRRRNRCLGASTPRILVVHMLPNVASSVIVACDYSVWGFLDHDDGPFWVFLVNGATLSAQSPDWGRLSRKAAKYLPRMVVVTFSRSWYFDHGFSASSFVDGTARCCSNPRLKASFAIDGSPRETTA